MLDWKFKMQIRDAVTSFIQEGGHPSKVVWTLTQIVEELSPPPEEDDDYTSEEDL